MDSELVFLLIVILTVVINIVKAINKKKAQTATGAAKAPSAEPALPASESDWQKVLRELLGETAIPAQPATHHYDEEPETLETLEPLGSYIKETSEYRFEEPVFTSSTFGDEPFSVDPATSAEGIMQAHHSDIQHHGFHQDLKTFDLRKAVVYATILNRPYA